MPTISVLTEGNTSALTAYSLGTLPILLTETDIDSAPGAKHSVWFTFVAPGYGIGVLAYAQNGTAYRPKVFLYDGPASAPVIDPDMPTPGHDEAGVLPTVPGNTYLLKIEDDGFGTLFTAPLELEVLPHPDSALPVGTILINDDTPPLSGAFLDRLTQDILGMRPFIQGEDGAMLPSGIFALDNSDVGGPYAIYIYDTAFALIASTVLPGLGHATANITNDATQFYYLTTSGVNGVLNSLSAAGVIGGATWTIPGVKPFTMAMDRAGAILYCARTGTGIRRFELASSTFLADLVANPGGGANAERDSFVLADGTILVCWAIAALTWSVRRYSTAGALLNTYPVVYSFSLTDGPRMAIGHDDTYFVIWSSRSLTVLGSLVRLSRFMVIRISDGVVLADNEVPVFEGGIGIAGTGQDTSMARFGNSKSCPILVLRAAAAPGYSLLLKLDTDIDGAGGGGGGGGSSISGGGSGGTTPPGGGYTGSGGDDDDEEYLAFIKTRAYKPGGALSRMGTVAQIQQPLVVTRKSLATLELEIDRNRGAEFATDTVSLVAAGTETRVIRKFEGIQVADAELVQFKLGDEVATPNEWTIDRFQAKISADGDV